MKRAGLLAALGLVALGATTAARAENITVFHFELSKSAPEGGAEVSSPTEVRLWFTQVPQDGTTSIRLVDEAGGAVHTADVAQDAADGRVFSVALHGTLAPGSYTVAWRAMGDDGHVVRGDYSFSVAAR
jgi:methionine-rich copper-binding protein CopC